MLGDFFPQERVTLLGAVAAKSRFPGHLVNGLMKGTDAGRRQCERDIADAHANDFLLRVLVLVCLDPFGNVGKQVAVLQLQVVLVDANHRVPFTLLLAC